MEYLTAEEPDINLRWRVNVGFTLIGWTRAQLQMNANAAPCLLDVQLGDFMLTCSLYPLVMLWSQLVSAVPKWEEKSYCSLTYRLRSLFTLFSTVRHVFLAVFIKVKILSNFLHKAQESHCFPFPFIAFDCWIGHAAPAPNVHLTVLLLSCSS